MIAFTSQLAHIVSCAYVNSPLSGKHKGFSAGSFKDMTRVARLNETMWTELFLENGDHLVEETDHLIENPTALRDAIEGKDAERLSGILSGRRCEPASKPTDISSTQSLIKDRTYTIYVHNWSVPVRL